MKFKLLSKREESIAEKIVDAAFTVHKVLGPGLLERVYEVCFCHELSKRELKYQRQVDLPITYDGMIFDEGLRFFIFTSYSADSCADKVVMRRSGGDKPRRYVINQSC